MLKIFKRKQRPANQPPEVKTLRRTAMFFVAVGVLGLLPSLYGLLIALMAAFNAGTRLIQYGTVKPVMLTSFAVILGFWWGYTLLLQYALYLRRSRFKCDPRWLWGLTFCYNLVLGLISGAIAVSGSVAAIGAIVWFGILCLLALNAQELEAVVIRKKQDAEYT